MYTANGYTAQQLQSGDALEAERVHERRRIALERRAAEPVGSIEQHVPFGEKVAAAFGIHLHGDRHHGHAAH